MTTLKEIAGWWNEGKAENATHMIVVCDTFDHDDYPVYVKADQDFWTVFEQYDNKNMQKVMEVYDYSLPWSKQTSGRVYNVPARKE